MSLLALVAWTTVVLALSLLALPLAAALFPEHPDRGAAFAPTLAVGVLTLAGYWIGHLTFGPLAPLSGVLVLATGSVLAWRRGHRIDRTDIAPLALPALVFAAAFAGLLTVRYLDPAAGPAAGEKFLDFGLLAVLQRTTVLPPEDVWFAGEPVRYYYGGPLAVTLLSDLAGGPPRFAYNLGLATFYAMLATAVYGLAAAVADDHADHDPGFGGPTPRIVGLTAVFLVAVGGRIATPIRLVVGQLPRDFAREHLGWAVAGIRMEPTEAFATLGTPADWSYWFGRYVVPDALHVYPSWAFLNGDLHAHLLATPFLVLAAATAIAGARDESPRRRFVLLVGVLPATAGLLGLVSTWSLPTAVGLGGLALALAPSHPLRGTRATGSMLATRARAELSRLLVAGLATALVGVLAVAWAHPFLLYQRPEAGGVGFMPDGASLAPLLLAHGLFLAIFAWGFRSFQRTRPSASWTTRIAIVLLAVTFVWAAWHYEVEALLLFVPVVVLGWYARRHGASDAATLAVAGAGILLVAEFAYAEVWPHDPNAPRWNTIYKISMQAFVLWGTAAGVVLGRKLATIRDHVVDHRVERRHVGAGLVAALLLVSAATFPALALGEHVNSVADYSENSLSATEHVENYHPDEAEALRWLRDEVSGTPTVVTAPGEPMYTWVSAPSSLTGVPAVVGWRHEAGYRGEQAYQARVAHTETIYEGNSRAAALYMDFHDVDYVYVGPVEKERYDIRRFTGRPGVSVAHQSGNVTIYAIDADAACEATNLTCPDG